LFFFLLHIIRIIVSINKSPKITAKTITAAKASNIAPATDAPIINPITTENAANNITAIIPKQSLFFSHFFSLLS
jgi:hypothetical protein